MAMSLTVAELQEEIERLQAEAERSQAEAERSQAEAERLQAQQQARAILNTLDPLAMGLFGTYAMSSLKKHQLEQVRIGNFRKVYCHMPFSDIQYVSDDCISGTCPYSIVCPCCKERFCFLAKFNLNSGSIIVSEHEKYNVLEKDS